MSDPRIVERVMKLFALAAGTNFPAEAAAARAKAEALIAAHNVVLPSIKDRSAMAWVRIRPHFQRMKWELILATAAADLCGCRVFFRGEDGEIVGDDFSLVGRAEDVEACQYLLAILNEQRMGAWMAAKARGTPDKFHSFCYSFAQGVERTVHRLIGQDEVRRTLAARAWYVAEVLGGVSSTVSVGRGQGRSEAGRAAGQGASLHRGTIGGETQRRLR